MNVSDAIWIILLLLIIIYCKWIAFIVLSPLVRMLSTIERKPDSNTYIEALQHPDGESPKGSKKSTSGKIKNILANLIRGYHRWMMIETGTIPSHHLRNFIYRNIYLVRLAPNATIYYGAEIRAGINLIIGEGSTIGDKAILDARNGITIGKNVNFSTGVHIWTEQHSHSDPYFRCLSDSGFQVNIGDRVWVGPGVTILHSVNIGEGAVISAGAVVTKDVPPFAIVAGIPAKKIGERNKDLRYELNGEHYPFL